MRSGKWLSKQCENLQLQCGVLRDFRGLIAAAMKCAWGFQRHQCSCSVVCSGISKTDAATVWCAQGFLESSGAHIWYINAWSFSAQPICSVLAHEFLRSTDLE